MYFLILLTSLELILYFKQTTPQSMSTHDQRLLEGLKHHVAYVEICELPQKIQSAHFFLAHNVGVAPSVQSDVQVDTKVLVVLTFKF